MDVIQTLMELIAIDSINPFSCDWTDPENQDAWVLEGTESEISDYLENRLVAAESDVRRQPVHRNRAGKTFHNLLAEKGSGSRSLLFYGHMDTVTARPWSSLERALTPRFEKQRIGKDWHEVVVGLGAADMKAGLAVLLTAFADMIPDGFKLKVAFGADEEFYSLGAHALAKDPFMDDVAAIIVPEIDDGPNAGHGPATMTIGRLGRCGFSIRVPGTGGHGAGAANSSYVNAATDTAAITGRLEVLRKQQKDTFTFTNSPQPDADFVNEVLGSFYVNRIEAGDGTLSIPAEGRVSVSYTFTPALSVDDNLQHLKGVIEGMYDSGHLAEVRIASQILRARVEPSRRPTVPCGAYLTPADHPLSVFVRDKIERTVGFRGYNMGYSVCDQNVFFHYHPEIPIIDVGPVGDFFHRAEEWVLVESVRQMQTLYRELADDFGRYLGQLETR